MPRRDGCPKGLSSVPAPPALRGLPPRQLGPRKSPVCAHGSKSKSGLRRMAIGRPAWRRRPHSPPGHQTRLGQPRRRAGPPQPQGEPLLSFAVFKRVISTIWRFSSLRISHPRTLPPSTFSSRYRPAPQHEKCRADCVRNSRFACQKRRRPSSCTSRTASDCGREAPIDLPLSHFGPPLDADRSGRRKGRLDLLARDLGLVAAAIGHLRQADFGLGLGATVIAHGHRRSEGSDCLPQPASRRGVRASAAQKLPANAAPLPDSIERHHRLLWRKGGALRGVVTRQSSMWPGSGANSRLGWMPAADPGGELAGACPGGPAEFPGRVCQVAVEPRHACGFAIQVGLGQYSAPQGQWNAHVTLGKHLNFQMAGQPPGSPLPPGSRYTTRPPERRGPAEPWLRASCRDGPGSIARRTSRRARAAWKRPGCPSSTSES